MTTVDLVALRDHLRPVGAALREHALAIDADPGALHTLLDSGVLPYRQLGGFPPGYLDDPLRVRGVPVHVRTCVERAVVAETLAWGDASVVVGAPGPSMSGIVVDDLADDEQRDRFYRRVAEPRTWTFFGLTEPDRGSDAAALETAVVELPGGPDDGSAPGHGSPRTVLRGHKKYVGNVARASLGVVFARHRPGPLGVGVYLVDTDRPGFDAAPLVLTGMRSIQLGEVRLRDVPLRPEDTLGRHLSPSRRGLLGAVRTFNRLRPVVASLAVGVTQAALDYVRAERSSFTADERWRLETFDDRLHAARALVLQAARAADDDPADGTLPAAAKAAALDLAEEVTHAVPPLLGPGARWEHPYLDKLVRDVPGLEMMEGTRTVQRLTLAQGWLQGRARHAELV
ncbi:acyl-CoA dehydrogenase family protein [Cellulosimicrobium protaetiae]|uniref:Acyl-CoA/acyl-ACP dehydrogenase n=1 Tax=Cellulosimicrobium protaetiae TaxID=2587808 RepID=A0A6M5UD46_9MICO|nr:acyl-CoA dehydrogenase family protein [Cellulosimicrobium protaetiae]QJW35093.1 acyl-CoA/acyl-ACP dehydrogenase [Cellulosimicrobium protaetiae]